MNLKNNLKAFKNFRQQYGLEAAIGLALAKTRQKLAAYLKRRPQISDPDSNLTNFQHPWDKQTTKEKIAFLQDANKFTKIIYVYPVKDYSSIRYRLYNPIQVINRSDKYRATFFYESELAQAAHLLNQVNLVIFVRVKWNSTIEQFYRKTKNLKIKTACDLDDLVYDLDYLPKLLKEISVPEVEYDRWYSESAGYYTMARMADYLISPHEFLAGKLRQKFPSKKVLIMPNFLGEEQVEISQQLNNQTKKSPGFRIGYFSGTQTHDHDLALIADELVKIITKNDQVKLRLVGKFVLPKKFLKFKDQLEIFGLQNFLELQKKIWECDLCLIPLVISDFTNSKSEAKFFDAGIVKVPVIASPTFIYRQVITEGKNGFLANKEEWSGKLQKLINQPKLAKEIGENAYEYCLNNYTGSKVAQILDNLFQNILQD